MDIYIAFIPYQYISIGLIRTSTDKSINDHSSSWFHEHNVCNGGVPLETGKLTGLYSISIFGFKPLQYILKINNISF